MMDINTAVTKMNLPIPFQTVLRKFHDWLLRQSLNQVTANLMHVFGTNDYEPFSEVVD
jgi:hypothetical protein